MKIRGARRPKEVALPTPYSRRLTPESTSRQRSVSGCFCICGPKDGSGTETLVNFVIRLEFQDGKRKRYVNMEEAATQFYHGRGTVHLHMLLWLENAEAALADRASRLRRPTYRMGPQGGPSGPHPSG